MPRLGSCRGEVDGRCSLVIVLLTPFFVARPDTLCLSFACVLKELAAAGVAADEVQQG